LRAAPLAAPNGHVKGLTSLKPLELPELTNKMMNERRAEMRDYTLLVLKRTPRRFTDEGDRLIWEHGRRLMGLREAGLMSIVCPVTDTGDFAGVSIFGQSADEVREILDGDPAVQAGVLVYELYPVRGFPGDSLGG
jgi:hypothetical protein